MEGEGVMMRRGRRKRCENGEGKAGRRCCHSLAAGGGTSATSVLYYPSPFPYVCSHFFAPLLLVFSQHVSTQVRTKPPSG